MPDGEHTLAEFENPSPEEFAAINRRTEQAAKRRLLAVSACYDPASRVVTIALTNGIRVGFPLSALPGLADAQDSDLTDIQIEGGGYGLHVPTLDADLSVPDLLEDYLGAPAMRRGRYRNDPRRKPA